MLQPEVARPPHPNRSGVFRLRRQRFTPETWVTLAESRRVGRRPVARLRPGVPDVRKVGRFGAHGCARHWERGQRSLRVGVRGLPSANQAWMTQRSPFWGNEERPATHRHGAASTKCKPINCLCFHVRCRNARSRRLGKRRAGMPVEYSAAVSIEFVKLVRYDFAPCRQVPPSTVDEIRRLQHGDPR
jgi:hypothetical protein